MKKYTEKDIEKLQKSPKMKGKVVSLKKNGQLKVTVSCEEETLTQQQYLEPSKIKNIIKKYGNTGLLHQMKDIEPFFDDVTSPMDYQTAQAKIAKANQSFEALPPETRLKFNNDPAEMLDWLNKSENKEEAIKLGLFIDNSTPVSKETQLLEKIVENTSTKPVEE